MAVAGGSAEDDLTGSALCPTMRRFFLITPAAVVALLLAGCATSQTTADCLDSFLAGIGDDRITRAESGVQDLDVIAASQTKQEPFAIVVTENRTPVLGIRVNFFGDGDIFKIESAIDDSCRSIRSWQIEERPGERTLQNWDTVILSSGDVDYAIRLGQDSGIIEANYIRVVVE
jgi:hypothetical protein